MSLAGFAQNGQADTMAPGALLGTILHAVVGEGGSGLPGLSDDQLIGVLSGARRMEAWTAWIQLAAMRELARRRPAVEPGDTGRAGFSDFAADEMMADFHMTWEAATGQIMYACTVADRLPRTLAALEAGLIHPVAVKIIEYETRFLSSKNVAKADQVLRKEPGMYEDEDNDSKFSDESPVEVATRARSRRSRATASGGRGCRKPYRSNTGRPSSSTRR